MFSISSSSFLGIEAKPVTIETDVSFGMSQFTIVGLPDASVKESRDRIRSAIKHSGFSFPRGRITVNLAPADIKKQGPMYDLPIALSILVSQGTVPFETFDTSIVIGELALDGSVRPIKGVLLSAIMAKRLGYKTLYVPKQNTKEACAVSGLTILGVESIRHLIDHAQKRSVIEPTTETISSSSPTFPVCFSSIQGQALAKRGLEIAAAGGHNVLLSGPPGTGKTLLARALPSILPPLTTDESIEATCIASIAGILDSTEGLILQRPFRAPHHSSSAISLVGGGSWPMPGEISLAHRGVLFLDELPEFPRHVLEHLRQPMEDGFVTISRAHATVRFPARFTLVAAMNPCPCGFVSDPNKPCVCTPNQIQLYKKRLSGPLLDRIDLQIEVSNIPAETLFQSFESETSEVILKRILVAKQKQADRFSESTCLSNAEIDASHFRVWCAHTKAAQSLLLQASRAQSLSPRTITRILKVARTIADLHQTDSIEEIHVAEALQFRQIAEPLRG